ncbi:MAG: DNA polymerase III subunit beta [Myxococcales bacterium]|nr:DNA polymerase III subunit beta [Myxococcales bacterium]
MQISIEAKALADELYKLLGVTNSKGPLTIVSNALLTATDNNELILEATDLEVTISTKLPCAVKKAGQLCLSAHNLYNVVKGLRDQKADITALDNHWGELRSGDFFCRIVGVPPVEFPKLPALGDLPFFGFSASTLMNMVDRTIFGVSTDEGRPNLMGANLVAKKGQFLMVSTDGHRLCRVHREIENDKNMPTELTDGIIIPRKSLTELRRTVDRNADTIELAVSGNNAVFRFGATTIMVRLVDATFPDVQRVVPEEDKDRQARINTAEFAEKLKFVSLFANPRTSNVSLSFDGDTLELLASDPDKGEGKETMPINYVGPKVQVGFNYRYLTEILSVLDEDQFRFQVTDAYSAALVLDGDRQDDLFLVMPMRL